MRGDARGGKLAGRIDLADVAVEAELMDEEAQLVLEREPALVHRLLVARRKTDRVQRAGPRQRERLAEGVEHIRAGCGAHPADRSLGQVDGEAPQQRRRPRRDLIGVGCFRQPEHDAGVLGAAGQHSRLADYDGRHLRVEPVDRQQPGDQLRPDPARIAEQQPDALRFRHGWPP